MRQKHLFLCVLFLGSSYFSAFSQVSKIYTYSVKFVSKGKVLINDICLLNIGKTSSFFYSQGKLDESRELEAMIRKSMTDGSSLNLDNKSFKTGICDFSIIKDYAQRKAIYVQTVSRQNLGFVRDSLSTKRWKILNEKKLINNFKCQKAQMKRDTTLITAWFCSDIPTQEGPLYYYGLPGLIVKVNSDAGWEASLVSIEKKKQPDIKIPLYTLITEDKLKKAILNSKGRVSNGKISLPNGGTASQKN